MCQSFDHLEERITTRIRQIERRVSVQRHFVPHFPRYHDRPFSVDCWCGRRFTTDRWDNEELARFIGWINNHAACAPERKP